MEGVDVFLKVMRKLLGQQIRDMETRVARWFEFYHRRELRSLVTRRNPGYGRMA